MQILFSAMETAYSLSVSSLKNLLLLVGGIDTGTSGGNVTGIIPVLGLPAGKGTGADTEISGTLNLTEMGVCSLRY